MNLLGAKLYDPGTAATKATSSLLAMTAFDTTNLRLTVTVPAHGMVRFKMRCQITGATTAPTVFLGVLSGATVVGRVVPLYENATANATSQNFALDAEFTATGLTPGSTSFDAAYAVQVVVASTNIKYGGPNNNSGANAWGAFLFEAWDPQPLTLALDGAVNVKQWNGTNVSAPATAGIPDVNVKNMNNVSGSAITTIKAVQGLATDGVVPTVTNLTNLPAITTNWLTASGIAASALNGKGDWNIGKTGYALSSAGVQAIWDALTSALTTVSSIGKLLVDNVNATISSRLASASYAAPLDAAGTRTALGLASANLDTQLTTIDDFLDTEIAAIKAKTDNLPASPANEATLTTIAGYIDTEVAAIKAKTDQLTFTTANKIDARAFTVDDKTGYSLTTAPLDASGTRAALGLASANLDTQLDALPTNAELATALAGADDAVLAAIAALNNLSQANVRTAIGLATANLDTQLDALPTNSELTAALASADDATLAAVAALNNLSSSDVQTAAAAALTAYDPPTRAEATSDKAEIITEVNANESKIDTIDTAVDAIKLKTDNLNFAVTGEVDANIKSVADTGVIGTGINGDEWGPDV